MKTYRIAVFPGDGIGPEVTEQAVRVLEAAADGFSLQWNTVPWGYEFHRRTGQVVPDDFLEVLRPHDAILLNTTPQAFAGAGDEGA